MFAYPNPSPSFRLSSSSCPISIISFRRNAGNAGGSYIANNIVGIICQDCKLDIFCPIFYNTFVVVFLHLIKYLKKIKVVFQCRVLQLYKIMQP